MEARANFFVTPNQLTLPFLFYFFDETYVTLCWDEFQNECRHQKRRLYFDVAEEIITSLGVSSKKKN